MFFPIKLIYMNLYAHFLIFSFYCNAQMDYASAINNLFMKEGTLRELSSRLSSYQLYTNEHLLFNKTAGVCKSRYLIIYLFYFIKKFVPTRNGRE